MSFLAANTFLSGITPLLLFFLLLWLAAKLSNPKIDLIAWLILIVWALNITIPGVLSLGYMDQTLVRTITMKAGKAFSSVFIPICFLIVAKQIPASKSPDHPSSED